MFPVTFGLTKASATDVYVPTDLPPPVRGLNAYSMLTGMDKADAVVLDNFLPFPDRLETRSGFVEHVTGASDPILRLHVYSAPNGTEKLFGTTDAGVYDVTSAGSMPASSIALTNGKTISALITTGAGSFMMVVNGTDSLKRFDGANWTSVSTFGSTNTSDYSYVEIYRQRVFFIKKGSLTIEYLPINSISGTPESYPLGAIFRRGGYLVAMGTWTIDSGAGPDDHLAVISSKGEVAVFAGSDPGSIATWGLRGVYYLGEPLGQQPVYKYGGDLLFLSENGLIPLSRVMQSTALELRTPITERIRQLFNNAAKQFRAEDGWQIISEPDTPILIVNIPSAPQHRQFVQHFQTGGWSTFSGWDAYSFARISNTLYFSTETGVNRVSGTADKGTNITATMLQAYSRLATRSEKMVKLVRPYLETTGGFTFNLGLASDLSVVAEYTNPLAEVSVAPSVWGTGLWGEAIWGSSESQRLSEWYTVPDEYSTWKAMYLQVVSNTATVKYLGADLKFMKD